MTFTTLYDPARNHRCQTPDVKDWRSGAIIQCDECKRMWIVADCQRDGKYWTGFTGEVPKQS